MRLLALDARRVLTALLAATSVSVLAACGENDTPTGTGGSSARLVFASDRDNASTGELDIYSANADGSDVKRLTNNAGSDEQATWSPDGTRLTFATNRDGNVEIYVMDADGRNQTRLTTSPGTDNGPRWSPNGSRIGFHSDRDGNFEIYMMNANGSAPTRLSNSPGVASRSTRIATATSRSTPWRPTAPTSCA